MPNLAFAKEVGYWRYFTRALQWRVRTRMLQQTLSFDLATGLEFPLPSRSFFARDVFVTEANVDWNAEYILAKYLKEAGEHGDFIDIGANIGYYTALISPLVRRTYAFEPDSRNHPHLGTVITRTGNARLIKQAVADKSGYMQFDTSAAATVSHLLPDAEKGQGEEVEVTSLDDFCRTHPDVLPVAVKVDIEGFDILALEGAVQVAKKFKPIYCIEFNLEPGRANSAERLQKFLETVKYDLYAVCRKDGSANYQYQFRQLKVDALTSVYTKMLFLTPQGESFFQQLAAKQPAELGHAMQPEEVRQFLDLHSLD